MKSCFQAGLQSYTQLQTRQIGLIVSRVRAKSKWILSPHFSGWNRGFALYHEGTSSGVNGVTNRPGGFRQAEVEAATYLKDKKKVQHLIQAALNKAYQHREQMARVWVELMALVRMVRAWSRGEYKKLPARTILMAIAAVIYFLNPLDLIPDFIPGIGYLDDATVIAFAFSSIRKDLRIFLDWECQKNESHCVA